MLGSELSACYVIAIRGFLKMPIFWQSFSETRMFWYCARRDEYMVRPEPFHGQLLEP